VCHTYESFQEQIEEEYDPKQLLENLKSKSIKFIVVPLEYHRFPILFIGIPFIYPLKSIYIIIFLKKLERFKRICLRRSKNNL
jgi:hypothetical protein